MKRFRLLFVFCFFLCPILIFADPADDFIGLGNPQPNLIKNPFLERSTEPPAHTEQEITERLFENPEFLGKVFERADEVPEERLIRLIEILRFKFFQEGKTDLKSFVPKEFHEQIGLTSGQKKKPDLSKGEWKQTPDGKKFWVSDDDPDLILSPAEYQHVLSQTSED